MPSVLFVCTANRFRSPIAAAWFSRCLQREADAQNWRIESAGTWAEPGLAVFPSASWIKDHFGFDLKAHKAVCVNRGLLAQYDLILVMEHNHLEALQTEFPQLKSHIFLLAKVAVSADYDITDPDIKQQDTFLEIARELTDLIDKGSDKICLLARQLQKIKQA